MTKEELLIEVETAITKKKVVILSQIAINNTFTVRDLIDLTFYPKPEIAFRMAWILENIFAKRQDVFLTELDYFISRFAEQKNLSCMRHYAKLMNLLTAKNAKSIIKDKMKNINFDEVVETLFSWLIDEKVPVAVKVQSMQALANLSPRYDWVVDALKETINRFQDLESVGFFTRAKQILKTI